MFPPASITVADVMPGAVEFCMESFGVGGHVVVEPTNRFTGVPVGAFDIAAMGSLLTHLSEENAIVALQSYAKLLVSGGIAIVTTNGCRARDYLAENRWLEIDQDDGERLLESYDSGRYGFGNYAAGHVFEKRTVEFIGKTYGLSLIHQDWMFRQIDKVGGKILNFIPAGWDNHQDVFIFRI